MDSGELDTIPAPRSTWLYSGMALLPSVVSTKPAGHSEGWLTIAVAGTLELGWCLGNKAVFVEMHMALRKGDETNFLTLVRAG